jgi:hypothetical protein
MCESWVVGSTSLVELATNSRRLIEVASWMPVEPADDGLDVDGNDTCSVVMPEAGCEDGSWPDDKLWSLVSGEGVLLCCERESWEVRIPNWLAPSFLSNSFSIKSLFPWKTPKKFQVVLWFSFHHLFIHFYFVFFMDFISKVALRLINLMVIFNCLNATINNNTNTKQSQLCLSYNHILIKTYHTWNFTLLSTTSVPHHVWAGT